MKFFLLTLSNHLVKIIKASQKLPLSRNSPRPTKSCPSLSTEKVSFWFKFVGLFFRNLLVSNENFERGAPERVDALILDPWVSRSKSICAENVQGVVDLPIHFSYLTCWVI